MARKRKKESSGGASWLETYSDLVTLLLTFFVLLYSISTVDAAKYARIAQAFSKGKMNASLEDLTKNVESQDDSTVEVKEVEDIDELFNRMTQYVDENNLGDSVEVTKSEEYVFIRFSDSITFDGYSIKLKQSGIQILDVLAGGLKAVDGYIEEVIIAGHTAEVVNDNSKIDRSLSTERANAVLQYLESKNVISPSKYLAIGYGLYSPIADNSTAAGRARNRRVEIYISRKGHPISYVNKIKDTLKGTVENKNIDSKNAVHNK